MRKIKALLKQFSQSLLSLFFLFAKNVGVKSLTLWYNKETLNEFSSLTWDYLNILIKYKHKIC